MTALLTLSSNGLAIHAAKYHQQAKQILALNDIQNLSLSGYINTTLYISNKNQLQIQGKHIRIKQHNHTLYVSGSKLSVAQIWIPKPSAIVLSGSTHLAFKTYSTLPIQIILKDNSYANLSGRVNLTQITSSGHSTIGINQLRGKMLRVEAKDHAVVNLRGKIEHLSARLKNNTRLDSRLLQLNSTWVQAINSSIANVSPQEELRAFATDSAQILYYQEPKHHTFSTKKNANILLIQKK